MSVEKISARPVGAEKRIKNPRKSVAKRMEIYLIRHTSVSVEAGICYGQSDVPVAESFAAEAAQVRAKLPPQPLVVHSSPLSRCRLLAESLAGQDARLDSRLLEMNFGAWELRRWDDIGLGSLNAWTEDVAHERCPDGESYFDVYHRAAAFWRDCVRERPERAAIVTHGGVIRALVAHLLEMPLEKSLRVNVDFGGVTKISFWQDVPIIGYINR